MKLWELIPEDEVAEYLSGARPIGVIAARAYLDMLNYVSYGGLRDYDQLLSECGAPTHFYYSSIHLDQSDYDAEAWVNLGVSLAISVRDVPDVDLAGLLKRRGLQEDQIQKVLGIITSWSPQLGVTIHSLRKTKLSELREYSFDLPQHTVDRAVKWLTNLIKEGMYPTEETFQAAISGEEAALLR